MIKEHGFMTRRLQGGIVWIRWRNTPLIGIAMPIKTLLNL
jgi:hypothetical protein